jgi:peptidase S41-like protein
MTISSSDLSAAEVMPVATRGVTRVMRPLVLTLLAALAGPTQGGVSQDAEDLATRILAHIRLSLPSAESRAVDAETVRVRAFAIAVMKQAFPPPEAAKLQASAIDAIDAARNDPASTADFLVRAAIAGVASFLIYGTPAPPATHCGRCKALPTSIQDGTIRVIALPSLALPEGRDPSLCSAFDHYFDFPTDGVSGVVLDLRGNQGGYLPVVICLTGEFLRPKTLIFRIASRAGVETFESPADGRRTPLAFPLVIFVDKDTESGALALAAALQDVHRASVIGESKLHANAAVSSLMSTSRGRDNFVLPVGEIIRVSGASLAAGMQADVAVSAQDNAALMEAARAQFGGRIESDD